MMMEVMERMDIEDILEKYNPEVRNLKLMLSDGSKLTLRFLTWVEGDGLHFDHQG